MLGSRRTRAAITETIACEDFPLELNALDVSVLVEAVLFVAEDLAVEAFFDLSLVFEEVVLTDLLLVFEEFVFVSVFAVDSFDFETESLDFEVVLLEAFLDKAVLPEVVLADSFLESILESFLESFLAVVLSEVFFASVLVLPVFDEDFTVGLGVGVFFAEAGFAVVLVWAPSTTVEKNKDAETVKITAKINIFCRELFFEKNIIR